jgi:hypothetical protein
MSKIQSIEFLVFLNAENHSLSTEIGTLQAIVLQHIEFLEKTT